MRAENQITYNLLCCKFRSAERDRPPRTNAAAAAGLQNPLWRKVWRRLSGGVGACRQHEVLTLRRRECVRACVCTCVLVQVQRPHRLKPLALDAETEDFICASLR